MLVKNIEHLYDLLTPIRLIICYKEFRLIILKSNFKKLLYINEIFQTY